MLDVGTNVLEEIVSYPPGITHGLLDEEKDIRLTARQKLRNIEVQI
jgi:hypothetical protein